MNGLSQGVTVDRRARLLRFGALIAAALMLSLSAFSTSVRAAESDPTIVLVHGAFASPAGWGPVADALHKDGYRTATPALGLVSVADDVAIVRSTLDSIPGDKILVGHSYGGFVITNAASGRTDVRGLVYTAAYVPDSGETITDLGLGYVLCQRIMQLHGGELRVESGNGSEPSTAARGAFHVILPIEGGTPWSSAGMGREGYAREKGDDSRRR